MINPKNEAARCLLCADAPCGLKASRAVRAIRFDNEPLAAQIFEEMSREELSSAQNKCIHYDMPIRLVELARNIAQSNHAKSDADAKDASMPSLGISYCGILCENPFFLASSAICTGYDMVARAFKAGWAGVFYKTICVEDIREVSPRFDAVNRIGDSGDFYGFRNMEQLSEKPYQEDFATLRRLKQDFPTKVVVASIMGRDEEEWAQLAQMAEEAGCDAVELNFSCPQMRTAGMGSDVGQNGELVYGITAYVKRRIRIPVIPKMTPNVAHMAPMVLASHFAGAEGISAINTIKSITMNPRSEVSECKTVSGYSGRAVKPIALRFIYEIASSQAKSPLQPMEISGIGGIETWRDALEFIRLGCRNVQVCTAVMQYGYRIIDDLIDGLRRYLACRGISRLDDIVGEELPHIIAPSGLDRDTKVFPAFDRERCIGCGRCFISCRDGGHQAIAFDPTDRKPRLIGKNCVGCHLCLLVCPTEAIHATKRVKKMDS